MRCDVVEGEPGIFPEPVTRFMRAVGGLFGGGRRRERAEDQPSGDAAPGTESSATEPPATEARPPEDDTP
jgi:hypothetical protein